MSDGARVEILEPDHEPGSGVLAMRVRVNGVDVGTLARAPKVHTGDGRTSMTTVTLVLVPSAVEIKGDEDATGNTVIGFA
ncbi:hypothetical protein NPS70_16600 [Streptomyces sp. C10-9-1]|uniref:hypothetical protein n=1 Tax=Streptomyces sp. C10-9-1 TaxID=1859285 RepID=UPI0021132226|nr:hypothetical protein [Streptomyces sp. C10-9-1]MCQ6554807.1 hypothetical protein [Streptomyces sp. C10-9-1]